MIVGVYTLIKTCLINNKNRYNNFYNNTAGFIALLSLN